MKLRLALCALTAPALAFAQTDPDLRCYGAEPYWSLEITALSATFSSMDGPDRSYDVQLVTAAQGRLSPLAYTLISQSDTAIAIVGERQCNDTMSDERFSHSIEVLTQRGSEAIMLTGCCKARP
jgi:uncharacterized membrane protein